MNTQTQHFTTRVYTTEQIAKCRLLRAVGFTPAEISGQTGVERRYVSFVCSGKRRKVN